MAVVTRHWHGIALVPETSISGGFLYIYINNDELEDDDDDECGSGGATSSFLSFSARADSALTLAYPTSPCHVHSTRHFPTGTFRLLHA